MNQQLRFGILIVFLFQFLAVGLFAQRDISFDSFLQENGLPNNQVQCVFQDSKGIIWVGTNLGLSRFDGYKFVNFLESDIDSLSIKGTIVRAIDEDDKGHILVGMESGGLNVFDKKLERFERPLKKHHLFKGRDISVNAIKKDDKGNIWLGTSISILKINPQGDIERIPLDSEDEEFVRVLQFDKDGKLWAGTNNGLFVINPLSYKYEKIDLPYNEDFNHNHEVWEIYLNEDGNLWIGSYTTGIIILNPETKQTQLLNLKPEFERSRTVRSIVSKEKGKYWIGTRAGLYFYDQVKGAVSVFRHDDREPKSLVNNSVLDIFTDRQGKIWIGTRGGLNLISNSTQVFHNYNAHPSDKSSRYLNSSVIYAFYEDDQGKIWVGTEDGGINIYDPKSNTYSYIKVDENNPDASISRNCIKAFQEDKEGNLWIGTYYGGISVLNFKTGKFTQFRNDPNNPKTLSDNRVWDIMKDDNDEIWVATTGGVDKFDAATGEFIHYPQLAREQVFWIDIDSHENIWLGTQDEVVIYNQRNNEIAKFKEHSRNFLEDSKGRFWITTLDKGIVQYSRFEGPTRYFQYDDGLCNNQALCILEDDANTLWISTSNGLSNFNPETGVFRNFSSKDGLRNNQFTYGAAYKTKDGNLIFGGISGFNIFHPEDVKSDKNEYPIVFTDLRVFNKKVKIGPDQDAVLKQSILETNHIVLDYKQNVFTLDFAALNYTNSEANLYSYYLEGFDMDWSEPSKQHSVTYTNLDPDDYVFRVKRIVPGAPDSNEASISVTILPPFWRTLWFKLIILGVIIGLIYVLIQFAIFRQKIKHEVIYERMNSKRQRELENLKMKFFTNISHEIRTPLSLIITPLEKLTSQKLSVDEVQSHLQIMRKSANKLSRLFNQLLDFRKLESGNLKLQLKQGDLVRFIADEVNTFKSFAEEQGVELSFNSLKDKLLTCFDVDKIENILNNLLSNAFKYTESGGTVLVNLSLIFDSVEDEMNQKIDKEFIKIVVKDTGRGISQNSIQRIFDRFYQAEDRELMKGTGIGLSYVKELVELHNGTISVSSKPGKGSEFTVLIPLITDCSELWISEDSEYENQSNENELNTVKSEPVAKAKYLLIVEDNADVRMLLKTHFESKYTVIEATNGIAGWESALDTLPDIIISDVLMPEMDGYEFCFKVKNDERTSHIPVILLTALHSSKHEYKGLSCGADDYITKPFDLNILQAKLENILALRKSLKKKFSDEITLQPKNVKVSSPDEKFLQRAVKSVEKNIANPELDIETFAKEVGVSRMQLYRKLDALTNMTVKEFIRNIRLKRAAQLIQQDKMTVNEISYAVGFRDVSHFRKCFRQLYGMNATEYKQKLMEE
ncbi:two-component regulator propeller domain-containing protein [Plebeiibacterium sediminum]|uniref:histidine kinase n=1 Tax=Plebeiibacterium sediminum TaxID=2992112 RepID=A0AAE3SE34_9BACT|nr:two-component regulator propeller domain-containing protein [Plebeiobacterium sediminum]MCW3785567.1 ATP-binding protein [Plebeiobacterium sediminum]